MSVDSYAPCPCGSGEKYKWCCQRIEPYTEKVSRLLENEQLEPALAAAEEGLRKVPGNPWLTMRKAATLIELHREGEARGFLEAFVKAHPHHGSAWGLLTHVTGAMDGPEAAVAVTQRVLSSLPDEKLSEAARSAFIAGSRLLDAVHMAAAIKHLELAASLSDDESLNDRVERVLGTIRVAPGMSPWLRGDLQLSQPPEGLSGEALARFREGVELAERGVWSQAAAIFQTLAAVDDRSEINFNLGLCRLWLADEPAAVEALRRAGKALGQSTEAVDLEALCQALQRTPDDDSVERVHLSWTIRDRGALLTALRASPLVAEDPEDEGSDADSEEPEFISFDLLDRPRPDPVVPASALELPLALGTVLVGQEEVTLEALDDGELDPLTTRFTDLAGEAIPPAQPRTQVVSRASRETLALRATRWIPPEISIEEINRLFREEMTWRLEHVWTQTPAAYLGGRTPQQAADAGDAIVPLRAALLTMEFTYNFLGANESSSVLQGVRDRLHIPREPEIDPETDIGTIAQARLSHVPVERLSDARLAAFFRRVVETQASSLLRRVALAVIERPAVLADPSIGPMEPFARLAFLALGDAGADATAAQREEALNWIRRGREADPTAAIPAQATAWDIIELRLRTVTEGPENWVPQLAVLIDRTRQSDGIDPALLSLLIELNLIQVSPHPDLPGEFLMDSRRLQAFLSMYGPRITTAEGSLGISAARRGVWTPESETGGSTTPGGIWTPGGSDTSGGEKKLIIPGR